MGVAAAGGAVAGPGQAPARGRTAGRAVTPEGAAVSRQTQEQLPASSHAERPAVRLGTATPGRRVCGRAGTSHRARPSVGGRHPAQRRRVRDGGRCDSTLPASPGLGHHGRVALGKSPTPEPQLLACDEGLVTRARGHGGPRHSDMRTRRRRDRAVLGRLPGPSEPPRCPSPAWTTPHGLCAPERLPRLIPTSLS